MAWYKTSRILGGGGGGSTISIPMIVANGNEYQDIELPINGNGDYTYKFRMYVPTTQNEKLIFGNAWNVNARLFHFGGATFSYYIGNSSTPVFIPYTAPGFYDVEASTDYIKVNDVTYTGTAATKTSGNIHLFGFSASRNSTMAIGEFKIYDNSDDSLVMDLVPMEDENTGYGYFHDTVGNNDYYAQSPQTLMYDEIGLVIIPKTITANGTYTASSDNATGYSPVTVNVEGASITRLCYVDYVGRDTTQIPVVNTIDTGTDYSSYLSYDNSTGKFTVLSNFSALIVTWTREYKAEGANSGGQFYINNTLAAQYNVSTSGLGDTDGTILYKSFVTGDTFYNYTPSNAGWPQQQLKVYKLDGFTSGMQSFADEEASS